LARALIEFGQDTDCKIIAEGVETEGEMSILRELGVHAAQGWLLGRPVPIEELWRVVI
jgi:EAL domain-containing protein (putative c-di-GMP-specific phosphodiesterase class I)